MQIHILDDIATPETRNKMYWETAMKQHSIWVLWVLLRFRRNAHRRMRAAGSRRRRRKSGRALLESLRSVPRDQFEDRDNVELLNEIST